MRPRNSQIVYAPERITATESMMLERLRTSTEGAVDRLIGCQNPMVDPDHSHG